MRVVVAPDKFAGSMSAVKVASGVVQAWSDVDPAAELVPVPMSDGGPGFVPVLHQALGGTLLPTVVDDPLGRPVPAELLLHDGPDGRTAYVESAAASGLDLLRGDERDPERTSSRGTGQLLAAALDAGARRLVVGLGGSAVNDGGAGMLSALGLRWTGGWQDPSEVDAGGLDPRLREVEIVVASDVAAPLLGIAGASAVFGPQKGATPSAVQRLDAALGRWSAAVGLPASAPGAGSAGGLGAALLWLGGRREPGARLVAQAVGLAEQVAGADLVVTGEGRYDATSLRGKVTAEVAARAQDEGLPCIVIAGQVEVGRREAAGHGIEATYSLTDTAGSSGAALAEPNRWLAEVAARVARDWSG